MTLWWSLTIAQILASGSSGYAQDSHGMSLPPTRAAKPGAALAPGLLSGTYRRPHQRPSGGHEIGSTRLAVPQSVPRQGTLRGWLWLSATGTDARRATAAAGMIDEFVPKLAEVRRVEKMGKMHAGWCTRRSSRWVSGWEGTSRGRLDKCQPSVLGNGGSIRVVWLTSASSVARGVTAKRDRLRSRSTRGRSGIELGNG